MKKHYFVGIISIVFLTLIVFPNPVSAHLEPKTSKLEGILETQPTKDASVKSFYPIANENYGKSDYLGCSYCTYLFRIDGQRVYVSGSLETYMFFSLLNKPTNYDKVELYLDVCEAENTINVTICEVAGSWGEMSITWNNKPAHGGIITTFIVSGEKWHTIDFTDYIKGDELSICLYGTNSSQKGRIGIHSKDYQWNYEQPHLLWSVESADNDDSAGNDDDENSESDEIDPLKLLPGYPIGVLLGIICGLAVAITKKVKRSKSLK